MRSPGAPGRRVPQGLARLIRFGFVGIANTGIYYGLYLLLQPHMPYLVAHLIAFVTALVCSYFLNCFITFRIRPRWRTFLLYPMSNLTSFALLTAGLPIAIHLGLAERVAPIVVAAFGIPVTYVVTRYILLGPLRRGSRQAPGVQAGAAD